MRGSDINNEQMAVLGPRTFQPSLRAVKVLMRKVRGLRTMLRCLPCQAQLPYIVIHLEFSLNRISIILNFLSFAFSFQH